MIFKLETRSVLDYITVVAKSDVQRGYLF